MLMLFSCKPWSRGPETTDSGESSQAKELMLDGTSISHYKIVYAKTKFDIDTRYQLGTEWDFDRRTAEKLAEVINLRFGVTVTIKDDNSQTTDHEILVGRTNRIESEAAIKELSSGDYTISMQGRKLVICGDGYGATWQAVCRLEKELSGSDNFTVSKDYELCGKAELINIACIGDSITAGTLCSDPSVYSWPVSLGRHLWKECNVFNFGRGSTTMRDDISYSYKGTPQYEALMSSEAKFDLIIIMLGTNDSYVINQIEGRAWNDSDSKQFIRSCKDFINELKEKNKNASFVLMNCPEYFGNETYASQKIVDLQYGAAKEIYGSGIDIKLFDMRKYSTEILGQACFPDLLHPDDAGSAKMALGVLELTKAILYGSDNPYFISLE